MSSSQPRESYPDTALETALAWDARGTEPYMRTFGMVMAAAARFEWSVWIAPSSAERIGGYIIHVRGPLSGHEHEKTLPGAVSRAKWWLSHA